jgi:uncharacterized protein YjbJ (UPF0337 family)
MRGNQLLDCSPAALLCGLARAFTEITHREDFVMGLPNKDEVEGKFDQAKGAVKENVGRAVDDREMESEGAADRAGGNIQEGYGTAKRKVGEAVEDIGK